MTPKFNRKINNILIFENWIYHGTGTEFAGSLKPDREAYMLDRAIGTHFSADDSIAKKFSQGIHNKDGDIIPGLYKAKSPPRSKLIVVPQHRYHFEHYSTLESDQSAIGAFVGGIVMAEREDLFIKWLMNRWVMKDEDIPKIKEIWKLLKNNKVPTKEKYGLAGGDYNTFRSYLKNSDSGLHMIGEDGKREVVKEFLKIMKSKGIQGLIYRNTSPMETQDIRDNKCYIIFNPEELEIQKV